MHTKMHTKGHRRNISFQLSRRWSRRQSWVSGALSTLWLQITISWTYTGLSISLNEGRGWNGSWLLPSPLSPGCNGSQIFFIEMVSFISCEQQYGHWMVYASALTSNVNIFCLYIGVPTGWYKRDPKGNCSAGNSGAHLSAWIFHLLSMLYDLVALTISTVFLFKMNIRDKQFSRLPRMWAVLGSTSRFY